MKILFATHNGISHEPLGLEYLSGSLLHAGHSTKACMESRIYSTIKAWNPDFIAFQVISGDQVHWAQVARTVKETFPAIKTIFGGPHFLFFSQANLDCADFVIRGEGENAIVKLVEGKAYENLVAVEGLDELAPPDRTLFYNDDFPAIKTNVIRNEIACRGCPYKCTYCYNSNKEWRKMVGTRQLRYHSPEWICEDIKRNIRDFRGDLVSFQDDIFGVDLEWLEEFARRYQKIRVPFFAQLRPYLITEERVRLLKEAGVHIVSFAIESGNEITRTQILDRHEPNELIERGCALLRQYGIKFRVQNMIGLPVRDPLRDALETLRFNIGLRPTLSWCSLLQAYPGTVIADYVVRKGFVKSLADLAPLMNATFFEESSLPIRDRSRIERLHKYWSAVVRWPWLYPFVKALIFVNFGSSFHCRIFEKTKQYINSKEYWRVDKRFVHCLETQKLDRLGGEIFREPTLGYALTTTG